MFNDWNYFRAQKTQDLAYYRVFVSINDDKSLGIVVAVCLYFCADICLRFKHAVPGTYLSHMECLLFGLSVWESGIFFCHLLVREREEKRMQWSNAYPQNL